MVLNNENLLRYDLNKQNCERASMRGVLDSIGCSFCQINSKRIFISGGGLKEAALLPKKPLTPSASAYSYTWQNHSVIKHKPMPAARMAHSLVFFLGAVYTLGGTEPRSMVSFNLGSGVWETLADMKHPHEMGPAICAFEDRRVLFVFGGSSNNVANALIERYEAKTGKWDELSIILPQAFDRTIHAAVPLEIKARRGGAAVGGGGDASSSSQFQNKILFIRF